jgi:HMG (high mobility group) box
MVSQAWKDLTAEEREEWEEMARQDKARYEVEKSLYTGPWKVPAKKRSQKDPNAPKRPMSAFLAYSHAKRAEVKKESPGMNNAEISRVLAQLWKDAPEEEKKDHIDKEYQLRQKYLSEIAVWRENTEKEFNDQRKHREDVAMKTVAARSTAASERDNGLDASDENQGFYDKDGEAMEKGDSAGPYAGYHPPRHHYYPAGDDQGQYSQDYRPPYLPTPYYHSGSSQQLSRTGGEPSQDGYDGYPPGYGYYAPPPGAAQYASGGHDQYTSNGGVFSGGYPPRT